jgi:hypothetical protein
MKWRKTFLAIAVAAFSITAFAQPPVNPQSSVVIKQKQKFQKQKLQIHVPFTTMFHQTKTTKIERAGNMSSRSWTQTVGWHPGQSAFPSADTHESKLAVFWIGHEPWQ